MKNLSGKLRIIGGKWRGKKFTIPPVLGVRPTPNRIRETLFNWLAPFIVDARCLDLFAGSGALGLEALSRGASDVIFVDQSTVVVKHLRAILKDASVIASVAKQSSALSYLSQPPEKPFDIIFLDPPFNQNLIEPCCALVEQNNWLSPHAYIYIETEAELDVSGLLPADWELYRSKKAGQVGYHLARANVG
jgi:16S rRNA (guanine966-N2)-methyltransferase